MRIVYFLVIISLLFTGSSRAEETLYAFETLEKQIRDKTISREEAEKCVPQAMEELNMAYFKATGGKWHGSGILVFPVKGYGNRDIGTGAYFARHFDFYNKNTKKTHPAYDIFIKDNNHDLADDDTGKKVPVIAASAGIVASVNTGWEEGSLLRGGNYVWIYNGDDRRLYYYAHLEEVEVKPGQFVHEGDFLGHVGRTGVEAAKKRSPTHLHLMTVEYLGGTQFRAVNTLKELEKAKKVSGKGNH